MHIVIGSEEEKDSQISKKDLVNLVHIYNDKLAEGLGLQDDFYYQSSLVTENQEDIYHTTFFNNYHTISKESAYDFQTAEFVKEFGKHGVKRGCRSSKKLKQNLKEKIELFFRKGKDPTIMPEINNSNRNTIVREELDQLYIILFTISASSRMEYQENIWDELKKGIKEVLDEICLEHS